MTGLGGQEFFASRWVQRPAHVSDDLGGGLPAGFRAANASAGIKPGGAIDLGLLVCDGPQCVSAARVEDEGPACCGEGAGECEAEATRGAGDQGDRLHGGCSFQGSAVRRFVRL